MISEELTQANQVITVALCWKYEIMAITERILYDGLDNHDNS